MTKQQISAYNRCYYLQHQQKIKARRKERYHANKHKPEYQAMIKEYNMARRAKTKSSEEIRNHILKLKNEPCVYCGGEHEHIDHLIPLVSGGKHQINNLVSSCATCNLRKGRRHVWDFLTSL